VKRLKWFFLATAWAASLALYCAPSQGASAPAMANDLMHVAHQQGDE
jgi:hypothetical protein